MREIELTDMRSVLNFLIEFPQWKKQTETGASDKVERKYADQVSWM